MHGSYDGIEFDILTITKYDADYVTTDDGIDYLYTHYTIAFTAYINPKAMSYRLVNGRPNPEPDQYPDVTLAAIREALGQPRKKLYLDILGGTIIKSPQSGLDGP